MPIYAGILQVLVKNPYMRAQTSGQLTASDPIRTTHENIAIYCGELPVFRKKKQRTIERGSLTKNP